MKKQAWQVRRALVVLMAMLPASFAFAQSKPPNLQTRIHLTSKPAVVKVTSGCRCPWQWASGSHVSVSLAQGSGAFISPDGYILTNAHVVEDTKDPTKGCYQRTREDLTTHLLGGRPGERSPQKKEDALWRWLRKEGLRCRLEPIAFVTLQSGKRFGFEIKSYGAPIGKGRDLRAGKDVSVIKIEVRNAPTLRIANSADVQAGDNIYVIGYPAAAESEALDQQSAFEPTVTNGTISRLPSTADNAPLLQTNAAATPGNSGGPAVSDKGEEIGLLTFHGNPVYDQMMQGFHFLVPSNTAMEFVRQAGVEPKQGEVDTKWRQGLEQFWSGDCAAAKASFTTVQILFPDHVDAVKYVTLSEECIIKGSIQPPVGTSRPYLSWLLAAGAVLLGAFALGVAVVLWRRAALAVPAPAGRTAPPAFSLPATASSRPPAAPIAPAPYEPRLAYAPTSRPPPPPDGLAQPTVEGLHRGVQEAHLLFIEGPLRGKQFPVGLGVIIGRDAARASIAVPDVQVSGQHAWVGPIGDRFVVRDQGSVNGTFLNDQKTPRISEVPLSDRDVIILGAQGSVKLMFRVG